MPRPRKAPRFGKSAAHEGLLLANLASDLIYEGKITTTVAKAKAVRPLTEKIITKARTGTLASRRHILKTITDVEVVTRLFDEVAPRFSGRPGGYTRITKVGPRRGDGAEMAVIELV